MTIKGILFDLDGTLLYTNDLVVESFQYTFKKVLNMEINRQEVIKYFGEPLETTFARFAPEKINILLKTYRQHNHKKHDKLTKIFPGVKETLKNLKTNGYKLAVVTSKKNDIARHGLDFFDILPYFDAMIGADDTNKHKPQPEPVLKALEKLNLTPKEAIMIGDSPYDILCAKNAGVYTAVVKYTEHPWNKLMELKPNYILENLKEVKKILY